MAHLRRNHENEWKVRASRLQAEFDVTSCESIKQLGFAAAGWFYTVVADTLAAGDDANYLYHTI